MSVRWMERLQVLGSLEPGQTILEEARLRATGPPPPRGLIRRRAFVGALVVVLFGLATYSTFVMATGMPQVAEIECGAGATEVNPSVVALTEDGLRMRIDNQGGHELVLIRSANDPFENWATNIVRGLNERTLAVPAGEHLVRCFSPPLDVLEAPEHMFVPLRVTSPTS
jgi:hypothetical protein